MRLRMAAIAAAAFMTMSATPALAQSGFVGGLGGLTFGTVSSGAVAGQAGVRVAPALLVIGEVGYMRNVLPKELQDDIEDLATLLALGYGAPVDLEISAPTTYVFGGLRWSPPAGIVVPFVEGGVGVGHVSVRVDKAEVLGIDFRGLIEDELDDEDTNATKMLVALGGGVTVRAARLVALDFGYRYTRIATDDPSVNTSMIYGALKVGF